MMRYMYRTHVPVHMYKIDLLTHIRPTLNHALNCQYTIAQRRTDGILIVVCSGPCTIAHTLYQCLSVPRVRMYCAVRTIALSSATLLPYFFAGLFMGAAALPLGLEERLGLLAFLGVTGRFTPPVPLMAPTDFTFFFLFPSVPTAAGAPSGASSSSKAARPASPMAFHSASTCASTVACFLAATAVSIHTSAAISLVASLSAATSVSYTHLTLPTKA